MEPVAGSWREAYDCAARLAPVVEWRTQLARALKEAAGAQQGMVFTCSMPQAEVAEFDCHPAEFRALNEIILRKYIALLEPSGNDWRTILRRHGPIFPSLEALADSAVTQALIKEELRPAGVHGLITSFLLSEDEDHLLGWIAISTTEPASEVLDRLGDNLRMVSQLAEQTIRASIDLARSCGAGLASKPSPGSIAQLSARERQIALLVLDGLSDLNIAARLGVTEATVGSHLHKIYRKLGVHSRVDLVRRLVPIEIDRDDRR